jgi:hypothetical protein
MGLCSGYGQVRIDADNPFSKGCFLFQYLNSDLKAQAGIYLMQRRMAC